MKCLYLGTRSWPPCRPPPSPPRPQVKGLWSEEAAAYGYDMWYQPRHNVIVSSSWGAPAAILQGFDPGQVPEQYGDALYFWDWEARRIKQTVGARWGAWRGVGARLGRAKRRPVGGPGGVWAPE